MIITDKCSLPSITAIVKIRLKSTILSVKRILKLKVKIPGLKPCFVTVSHLSLSMSQPRFRKVFLTIKYCFVELMSGLSKIRNLKDSDREKLLNEVILEKLDTKSY